MGRKKIFICIGMAGSGKTLFCQRLYSWLSQRDFKISPLTGLNEKIFSLNLDPAVLNVKMPLNEDIRDKIDYYKVMKDHNLGPNGAIITCLNLYMININNIVEKINTEYVIVDTPGQIEAFTWSSSGYVFINSLKTLKEYDIKILYIIDSLESINPGVFMSNMIYSASLMIRFQVETIAVFNKNDISDCKNIILWIEDYEKFIESLDKDTMANAVYRSMALYFEEFYRSIKTVSVSALTGSGKCSFFEKIVDNS